MKRWRHDAWKILHQPTAEQIDEAQTWLYAQPDEVGPGFFLEGPEGDLSMSLCYEHAIAYQRYVSRFDDKGRKRPRKVEVYLGRLDGDEDGSRWCDRKGCNVRLRVSLTDSGVDSALGLTEEDPMDCCIDVRDLMEADGPMDETDERRKLWYHHVNDLRGDPVVVAGPEPDPGDV